jgi:hypothetical protein
MPNFSEGGCQPSANNTLASCFARGLTVFYYHVLDVGQNSRAVARENYSRESTGKTPQRQAKNITFYIHIHDAN